MQMLKNESVVAFMIAAGISLLFVGCAKKDLDPVASQEKSTELSVDPEGAYYMIGDGSLQQIDLEALQSNQELTFKNGNGNAHVNAHYSFQPNSAAHGFYKSNTVQINITENSQGVKGVGHWWRTWGDDGEFSYHIIMEADCLESNGEEAIFVGIVTEILGDSPGFPTMGSRVWIRVKDNGQGANAPLDQYKPAIIMNPSALIPCEVFGLNSIIWAFTPPYEDVANSSDHVSIN